MTLQRPTFTVGAFKRPTWVSSNSKQKVILIRDASSSMAGEKASDATAASQDLVNELARPENKEGFYIGVIDYSNRANMKLPFEKAAHTNTIPNISAGGQTNITSALVMAKEMLEKNISTKAEEPKAIFLKPVILLFTDGQHNTGISPEDIAAELKETCDIVTIAFGSDADEALLKKLASSPQHFYRTTNGADLRQFMAKVGHTITGTLTQGLNAGAALANI